MTPAAEQAKKRRQAKQLRAKAESTNFPAEAAALVAKAAEIEAALPPEPEVRIVEKIVYVPVPTPSRAPAARGATTYRPPPDRPFSGGVTRARAERAQHLRDG